MVDYIYLDNAATTKPFESSLKYAEKFNNEMFYNPSALYHGGVEAQKELLSARQNISKIFGGNYDVIFTSCGSEADNTAIFSYFKRGNAVTTLGEHSAVYEPFCELKNRGLDVRFAKLNKNGSVNVEDLLSKIDKNTVFVSVIHVNSETGGINDINYIAKECKKINKNLIFHSDGVQAFLKVPFKPCDEVDLYSVSAHKINALKGVGALLKNKKLKNLKPLIYGGGQEGGLRSGTENLFGIKTFEYSALSHYNSFNDDYLKAIELSKEFLNVIDKNLFKVISQGNCSPYIVSITAVGLKGEVLQHKMEEHGVIIGNGSACSSRLRHSRVLKNAGYIDAELDGVIRVSFSSQTKLGDVVFTAKMLNECATELKSVMYRG